MAQEGTLNLNLMVVKNGETLAFRPRPITPSFDVSGMTPGGNYPIHQTFTIGTSDMTLDIENVGTPGFLMFFNTDPTSTVKLGGDGASYPIRLRANGQGYALFEWNGVDNPNIHAISTPGSSDIEALILPE